LERDNAENLEAANRKWEDNPRDGTVEIYREFVKMIDVVMPIKTTKTKSGDSTFPLSQLYWKLKKQANTMRSYLGDNWVQNYQYKFLKKPTTRAKM
jgi:hypothetical protein